MPTILITGANRGLGLEFAKQYGAQGWRVIATLRDPLRGAELSAAGAEIYVCDVSYPEQITKLAQTLKDVPLDLLVLNAAQFPDHEGIAAVRPDSFLQTMAVNTLAPLLLARAFLPQMTGRKIIAAMSSRMGSITDNSSGGSYAYRASKAALNMGFKTLSLEPVAHGSIIVMLSPGWVVTDMGGAEAPMTVTQSVSAMRNILDELTPERNGQFIHYDGTVLPW